MTITLILDKDAKQSLSTQVYEQLRTLIVSGELPAGAQLPPSRQLAGNHDIGRMTVIQAYDQLQLEGFVNSVVGAGTFVAQGVSFPAGEPFLPDLATWGREVTHQTTEGESSRNTLISRPGDNLIDYGFGRSFPHIFPYDIWRRLLARYLSIDDVMLSRYGSVAGFAPLREAIAEYLSTWRGVHCNPEQVVIVSGAQQAFDIIGRLYLAEGDRVLVENPGYTDAYTIFAAQGVHILPLDVDAQGCKVETIPAGQQARLVFITPANQFPQGGTLPAARRMTLLRWAREADALIIEDDYDGELRYDARPVGALQGLDKDGRVIYSGTFSKVLFPALRLGYLVLPPNLIDPFLQAKRVVDRAAPTLTQAAVADFIAEGHFERHLRRLRNEYGKRRSAFVAILKEKLPQVCFSSEPAGLHIMLLLPKNVDEEVAIQSALRAGVRLYPGSPYYVPDNIALRKPPPSVLMGFTGLEITQIEEGVQRLADAWRPYFITT